MKITFKGILSDPLALMIGALQGLGVYYFAEADLLRGSPLRDGLLIFCLAAPATYLLSDGAQHRLRHGFSSLLLGLVIGGLTFWLSHHIGSYYGDRFRHPPGHLFAISILWLVGTAVIGETEGRKPWAIPYTALINRLSRIIFSLLVAVFFIALAWVVLFLWATLFKLVGIDIFERILRDEIFTYTARGALFGAALALLREIPAATDTLHRFTLATFRLLAPVLAFFAVLFLASLSIIGFDPLWETGRAAAILISVATAFIIFVNGYVGDGTLRTDPPRPVHELLKGAMILVPLYPVLALFALWLRIADYGLSPPRTFGVICALIALVVTVGYALARLVPRGNWRDQVASLNRSALLAIAIGLPLLYLPGVDPVSLSARSQFDRVQSAPSTITLKELGYLKYELGKPGEKALAEIGDDADLASDPAIQKALSELADTKTRSEWQQRRFGLVPVTKEATVPESMIRSLATYPADSPLADALISEIRSEPQVRGVLYYCDNPGRQSPGCAILNLDLNRDGVTDAGLWNGFMNIYVFLADRGTGDWAYAGALQSSDRIDSADLKEALERGEIGTAPPRTDDVMIGGARFR